jgi:hypothetical protein
MPKENAKFKHYRTDKTVVHISNEPNVLIIDRKLFTWCTLDASIMLVRRIEDKRFIANRMIIRLSVVT